MKLPFRNIIYGVQNLVKWFSIIWKDRDWDSYFILNILRFKLTNVEKCLRQGHYVGCERDANNVKKCIYLINRIVNDEYENEVYKKHDKKWGEIKMSIAKNGYLNIERENVTDDNKEQERKEYSKCVKQEDYLYQQDIRYLFEIMTKHLTSWWD